MQTSSPDSFPIKSEKSLPGTHTSPSSNTSALTLLLMESSPSVASRLTSVPYAESLMHSMMGAVVLTAHALLTFMTASERESPSHTNFIALLQ